MGLSNSAKQGPNFVPAYQMSGTPWVKTVTSVSDTAVVITFPFVTRWIVVTINDAIGEAQALRIGFTQNGVNANPAANANYMLLTTSATDSDKDLFVAQTPRLELRTKELVIRSDSGTIDNVSIMAGLTGIEWSQFPILSGSAGFAGVG